MDQSTSKSYNLHIRSFHSYFMNNNNTTSSFTSAGNELFILAGNDFANFDKMFHVDCD